MNMDKAREKSKRWQRNNKEKKLAMKKRWELANPQKHAAIEAKARAKYKEKNGDKLITNSRLYRLENAEKIKRYKRDWYLANRHQDSFKTKRSCAAALRLARKVRATPSWANHFFIAEAYDLARTRTKVTGFEWHVDHIVPLRSKRVCGLHVENNLQVIPAAVNMSKQNRHWPDMPEERLAA